MKNNKKGNIILNLAIPKNCSKEAQVFFEFCVDKFGGKSDLFRVPSLDDNQLDILADEFLKKINKRKEKNTPKYKEIGDVLFERDFRPIKIKFSISGSLEGIRYLFEGIEFAFISEREIGDTEYNLLGKFFIRKMSQLFNVCNQHEQDLERQRARNELLFKKKDDINYNSSANYFIYER